MATFIPTAAKLRESFLSPVSLRAPLPARSENEKAVRRLDIRQYRHTATAACHESAWISLCAIVADTEKENAFVSPRSSELNLDKVFFRSFRSAAIYCGLFQSDLNHLHGVEFSRQYLFTAWAGRFPAPTVQWQVMGFCLFFLGPDVTAWSPNISMAKRILLILKGMRLHHAKGMKEMERE